MGNSSSKKSEGACASTSSCSAGVNDALSAAAAAQAPTAVQETASAACPAPGQPRTNAKGKKICCVCKETKGVRDECIVRNGEERCVMFIEAHNQCLRSEGFDVA